MAVAACSLRAEGRERVAAVLRALLIAQLVVSLCMLIFCYNAALTVVMLLKEIHKLTALLLYGLVLLQAYAMKLQYTAGLRLITWLLKFPAWGRCAALTRAWTAAGSLVAANGMLVTAACHSTVKALMTELAASLRVGISQYLTEPTWKRLLDTMQVELSCCGIERASDWHEIPWINMDFLNEQSDLVMKLAGADGKILPPVAPYSCCSPRVLAACYHDPLQQAIEEEWRDAWSEGSPLLSASLHARGCVDAVRAPLTKALLGLKYFNILCFILQIFIVILSQLLRTSACDAALRGDAGGSGRGALIGSLRCEQRQQCTTKPELEVVSSRADTSPPGRRRATRRRRRRDQTPSYPYLS
ncbi:RDS/peripherin-like protein xRDS35 [Plutella xylostella]|uniref:RDS/peripherin-like protein xRDS35 n=1 Tax=Plutella xylostella TaxID=51655 RepID=UPI002032D8A5|nr:RDS/peripherin-like protein xRDS35 [Plutella xylostella]